MGDTIGPSYDEPRRQPPVELVNPKKNPATGLLFFEDLASSDLLTELVQFHTTFAEPGQVTGSDGEPIIDLDLKRRSDAFLDDRASIRLGRMLDGLSDLVCEAISSHYDISLDLLKVEEFRIGCYSEGEGFSDHRDDERPGTETRRCAFVMGVKDSSDSSLCFSDLGVSIWLRPASGVIFPCNLQHHMPDVKTGKRYVLVTFVHEKKGL